MAEDKTSQTPVQVDPLVDADSKAAEEEIEADSLDLRLDDLVDQINYNREIAFSPDTLQPEKEVFLSLPKVMEQHGRRLGLTEKQLARAAANQGLDLGVLVDKVGRQGKDAADVFKELESQGMVALKPLEERKSAMKDLRLKRQVKERGAQIKKLGTQRILTGEKQFEFTPEELKSAEKAKVADFKALKDPSKRQAAVAQVVYDMGTQSGLSRNQMAAILANGIAESKLDPMAVNPVNEDSHGVWQFNRSGSGEGAGFTVEQLQDPKFQMAKIIEATQTRDELKEFRDAEADANELTKQFMLKFEKPARKPGDVQARQNYLKQANRLLDQASKAAPRSKTLAELDRQKRMDMLAAIQKDTRRDYILMADRDAAGGDVQNEIAQPGSAEYASIQAQTKDLSEPKGSSNPERAAMIADILAKASNTGLHGAMKGHKPFQDLMSAGIQYDTKVVAKKLGMSVGAFTAAAGREGSRENAIRKDIIKANKRHVAMYLTVGKLNIPAVMSYEFMDPDNYMGEDRPTEDDAYFERLFDAAGKNRVQLIGLKNGLPIYRAEDNLQSLFNKLNLHLSFSAGALRRLMDGPESESVLEALKEGSIEGIQNADDFTKLMLSREGAEDGGLKAFSYGSLGFLVDVLAPDPTIGLAKVASRTREGVRATQRFMNKQHLPEVLDNMSVAANDHIEVQKLLNRAADSFRPGTFKRDVILWVRRRLWPPTQTRLKGPHAAA